MKCNLYDKEYENDSQSHNNYFSNQPDVKVDCGFCFFLNQQIFKYESFWKEISK